MEVEVTVAVDVDLAAGAEVGDMAVAMVEGDGVVEAEDSKAEVMIMAIANFPPRVR
jgi:hypothetical protein